MHEATQPAGAERRRAGTRRLFYAVWPDTAARDALAELAAAVAHRTGGRPTSTPNLHLTVLFLGALADEHARIVPSAGEAAARAGSPFVLTLERMGGFRDAGVAWAGPRTVPPPLATVVTSLRAVLLSGGLAVDARPFRAHVTLARKCDRALREELAVPIAWHVHELTLVASTLAPGGSRYDIVARWPLG